MINYKRIVPKKFSLSIFNDKRGYLFKLDSKLKKYSNSKIVYEYFTYSKKKNIFRGLHFQKPPLAQDKFVIVVSGKIIDYVIDIRSTGDFGKIYKYNLKHGDCIWIPKGYCHGYKTLSENVIMNYRVSNKFSQKQYSGISPDCFNIDIKNCEMSPQDKNWKHSLEYLKKIKW